jgi:tetraacyldisaccharide 4'-kinase
MVDRRTHRSGHGAAQVNPLSAVFGAVVRARNEFYDRGTLRAQRLQGPVISIGNISTGGTGKTPFLILLGELLKQRSILFDVLSRGYRRESTGVALVNPAGTARQFGDEPLLIARKLGVPVIVGEDRFAAGQYAEQNFGPQLHLLDDGFQHRSLARDFDIVLLTPTDVRDTLLPAGRLREPLPALARADAVVLSGNLPPESVPQFVKRRWRVQRSIFATKIREKCIAFCGIARPESFFTQVQHAGLQIAATQKFRDHHPYDNADIQKLLRFREQHDASAFVTTEKDAVNLGEKLRELGTVHVIPLHIELEDADSVVKELLECVAERKRGTA